MSETQINENSEENQQTSKIVNQQETESFLRMYFLNNSNPTTNSQTDIFKNFDQNKQTILLFSSHFDYDKFISDAQSIFEKGNLESNHFSSFFTIPQFDDRFFIEVLCENDKEIDKSKIIEEIQSLIQNEIKEENISHFLPYFLNIHYFSYLNSDNNIFRINDPLLPSIHNKPCQLLDINFMKKECIVSINCKDELIELAKKSTILKHLSHEKRVFMNFAKTKYLDNGFCLKDENYLGIYKIIKIQTEKLITPEFANITDEEKALFTHKYDEDIDQYISDIQIAEDEHNKNEQIQTEQQNTEENDNQENKDNKITVDNTTEKAPDINANIILPNMYISVLPSVYQKKVKEGEEGAEENMVKQDIISLYSLVRLPETLDFGVVIDISIMGYTILMSNNTAVQYPLTSHMYTLSDDNSGRDVEKRRIFVNDCVRIVGKNEDHKNFTSSVIHVYKKKVFGNFSNGYKTYQLFVDSNDTLLTQDDEGPF